MARADNSHFSYNNIVLNGSLSKMFRDIIRIRLDYQAFSEKYSAWLESQAGGVRTCLVYTVRNAQMHQTFKCTMLSKRASLGSESDQVLQLFSIHTPGYCEGRPTFLLAIFF